MPKGPSNYCNPNRGPHGASHPEWGYRNEAFIWAKESPKVPNMLPFAKQMSLWTQRRGGSFPLCTLQSSNLPCHPNNPYTYSLGTISLAISHSINDAISFSESIEEIDEISAEIARIRYESELIIFAARFCEAAIKQMLYCTAFPSKLYATASMGQLLAQECRPCKNSSKTPHDISLLGALAHRFLLCHTLDRCAFDHLQLVARRRNLEAAHSDSQRIHPRTTTESRQHLAQSIKEIGYELGHMADHLGSIEERMLQEIALIISSYPASPAHDDLWRIPVRF